MTTAPRQQAMVQPFDRQGTAVVRDFREAHWLSCLGYQIFDACSCWYKTYRITERTFKVIKVTPCSQEVNNISAEKIIDVDVRGDMCFGYIDVWTTDNELGDEVIRVRRGDAEAIQKEILAVATRRDPRRDDTVDTRFREAARLPRCRLGPLGVCGGCSLPCPVPGFLFCAGREFVLSPMQLRVIDDGCCHFSVNSVRWGSVVDVDEAADCFFSYVDVSTHDRQLGDTVVRIPCGTNGEKIAKEMNNLMSGRQHDAEDQLVRRFREADDCLSVASCGLCQLPKLFRCCETEYFLSRHQLRIRERGCFKHRSNYVRWGHVRDVDTDEDCCFGYLDVITRDDEAPNLYLKVPRREIEAVATEVQNLRRGADPHAASKVIRVFREAGWCPIRCMPTQYILKDQYLQTRKTKCCTGFGIFKRRTNNVDWHKIVDVDYETDCCFGYVDLSTRDREMQDIKLRVRKGQIKDISRELHNKALGFKADEKEEEVARFREAGFFNCSRCFGTSYAITPQALKVKETHCMRMKVNNVRWQKVHDLNYEQTCCYAFLDLNTGDDELGDVVLRVWRWEGQKLFDAMVGRVGGRGDGSADEIIRKFHQKSWCSFLACYHPKQYIISKHGFKIRTIKLCSRQGGVYRSRINNIPWHKVRDVDKKQDCCWAYLDVDTTDKECSNLVIRVTNSEIDAIMQEMRDRRVYHVSR